jgi:hypothetical protein
LEAYPGPPAILLDELNAGSLQGAADGQVIGHRHRRLSFCEFGAPNGCNAQCRLSRKVFGTPPDEGAGSSYLGASERLFIHLELFNIVCYLSEHKLVSIT